MCITGSVSELPFPISLSPIARRFAGTFTKTTWSKRATSSTILTTLRSLPSGVIRVDGGVSRLDRSLLFDSFGLRPHPSQHPRNIRLYLETWLAVLEAVPICFGGMQEDASVSLSSSSSSSAAAVSMLGEARSMRFRTTGGAFRSSVNLSEFGSSAIAPVGWFFASSGSSNMLGGVGSPSSATSPSGGVAGGATNVSGMMRPEAAAATAMFVGERRRGLSRLGAQARSGQRMTGYVP